MVTNLMADRDSEDAEKAWVNFASKYLLYFNQEKIDIYDSVKLDIYKRGFIEGFNYAKKGGVCLL